MTATTIPQAARGQESRTHAVKSWPHYYELVVTGIKNCCLRWNDRDYRPGDVLHIHEYDPDRRFTDDDQVEHLGCFTGRDCERLITHVMHGGIFGLQGGYVLLSLRDTTPLAADPDKSAEETGNG